MKTFLLLIALGWIWPAPSLAIGTKSQPQRGLSAHETPKVMANIGITEHLGDSIDLNLPFTDENGAAVKLGDYFDGKTPVLLSFVYFTCPMLCSLILDGLTQSLKELEWTVGKEFKTLIVSFDPNDTPEDAAKKKAKYLKKYGRNVGTSGLHFLTGDKAAIEKITNQIGFQYKWDAENEQWGHAAASYVLTPTGKISYYHYGIKYDPVTMRLSLVEASGNKIGTIVDRVLLFCLRYDPTKKTYAFYAMNLMRVGGGMMFVILAAFLFAFWRKQSKKAHPNT